MKMIESINKPEIGVAVKIIAEALVNQSRKENESSNVSEIKQGSI